MSTGWSARAVSWMLEPRTPEWTFAPVGGATPNLEPEAPEFAGGWPEPDDDAGAAAAEPELEEMKDACSSRAGQVFAARIDFSSSRDGADPLTTTSVTRRTTRPEGVRMEMRYVPGPSCCPCTRPEKRTRLMPDRPRTVKCPTPMHCGET